MPTELPPPLKKPLQTETGSSDIRLTRTLNWLAVIIGIGLCFYALEYGLSSPEHNNSPSLSATEAARPIGG